MPGGTVDGVPELADEILRAQQETDLCDRKLHDGFCQILARKLRD